MIATNKNARDWLVLVVVLLAGCKEPGLAPQEVFDFHQVGAKLPVRFVTLGKSPRFTDRTQYATQGLRNSEGGCSWGGERRLARGERIAERLVGYDPLTCELAVARGDYTPRLNQEGMTTRRTEVGRNRPSVVYLCGSNPSPCNGIPTNCQPASVDVGRAWQRACYDVRSF